VGNLIKDDVVMLGGREFKRVKNGVDEAQVASFIDELVSERDKLAQFEAHRASLIKLAEKTVTEADRLAEETKTEALKQANAESVDIISKAKEQAQRMSEKTMAETIENANKKALAIQAEAEKKAALLLENQTRKIQDDISKLTNQHFAHILEQLENLKQQALETQANLREKFSQPMEMSNAVITKESNVFGESLKQVLATNQDDKNFTISQLLDADNQVGIGDSGWEIEILPPIDMAKIMKIVAYLDQLPAVENTEIIPRIDKPSIMVSLRESINIGDVLKRIPEIASVEFTTAGDATNGKTRKVRIRLSGSNTSGERK
jgi:cell division septum initiation protein DivIVA